MVRGREELHDGGNRGFTLVELIVALVILSILAAVVVPGLLSYIDDYKEKELLTRAQTALAAAQAEVTTCYNRAADNQNIEEMLGETDDEGITRLEKIARAANMPGGSEAGFNMKAAPAIATPKNRDE